MEKSDTQGVIILDKPAGLSSARAVSRVKRLIPRGTKIGHAGTLDPFATGVLLLLVGKATKSCEQLMGMRKGYESVIKLGATTATDDLDSPEQPVEFSSIPTAQQVHEAAQQFIGQINQLPPMFSALKVDGHRAYDLARKGKQPQLQSRIVNVYLLEVMDYTWPLLRIRVECGRGTYIRALGRDLGAALKTGGHLRELRRTFIGDFYVQQSVTLEQLQSQGVADYLRPVG